MMEWKCQNGRLLALAVPNDAQKDETKKLIVKKIASLSVQVACVSLRSDARAEQTLSRCHMHAIFCILYYTHFMMNRTFSGKKEHLMMNRY